jgi:hypothetical protein
VTWAVLALSGAAGVEATWMAISIRWETVCGRVGFRRVVVVRFS